MDSRPFSEKESRDLISRLIDNTYDNLENKGRKYMLIWGYTTLIVSLVVYLLYRYIPNIGIFFIWFAIPIIGGILTLIYRRRDVPVKTYIDKIIENIWLVMGGVAFLIGIGTFFVDIAIFFSIALIISMGTTLTGLVIRFKTALITGIAGILLSFLLCVITGLNTILIFAAIMLLVLIIPGHLISSASQKNHNIIQ